MKMTVIQMIQEVLSYIDGDEVTTYNGTVESEQVYSILRSAYFNMMSNRMWPHTRKGTTIATLGDVATPTHMLLDDKVREIVFINYNVAKSGETRKKYVKINHLSPDEFIYKTNQENSDKAEVQVVTDLSGIELLIRNDRAPTYYTSFDDSHIVMDSFDSAVATTLETAKIQAQAYIMPTWTENTDGFIPDLPDHAFRALVESAKSIASNSLIQTPDAKAEQETVRQNRWIARNSRRVSGGIKYPNYGRRR